MASVYLVDFLLIIYHVFFLHTDLQNHFEVCSALRTTKALLELVQSDKYQNHHIFIDEIHVETNEDIENLKEMANICSDRTLWITITSTQGDEISDVIKKDLGYCISGFFFCKSKQRREGGAGRLRS